MVKQLLDGGAALVYDSTSHPSTSHRRSSASRQTRSIDSRADDLPTIDTAVPSRYFPPDSSSDTYAKVKPVGVCATALPSINALRSLASACSTVEWRRAGQRLLRTDRPAVVVGFVDESAVPVRVALGMERRGRRIGELLRRLRYEYLK